jgi:hypothetical protein
MDEVAVFNYTLSAVQLSQLYAIATTGLVLTVQRLGRNVVVSWPLGTLQQANSLTGPWYAVASATSPYTNAPAGGPVFYRSALPTP